MKKTEETSQFSFSDNVSNWHFSEKLVSVVGGQEKWKHILTLENRYVLECGLQELLIRRMWEDQHFLTSDAYKSSGY